MDKIGEVTRPLLRYHGGKWMLAPWIISHFPNHRIYTESFGGAASVLLRKEPCYCEVYNDLDGEVVNLFRILRTQGKQLIEALILTPFAKEEFELSYKPTDDDFERARRTIVRSYMGYGSDSACGRKTGFRSNSHRLGTTPAKDWKSFPNALEFIIQRLRGVVIENRQAIDILKAHDSLETLHYLDPTYVLDTRWNGQQTSAYKFEMTNEQHEDLLSGEWGGVKSLQGYVIISGYDNDLYNDLLPDFNKVSKKVHGDYATKRTEVLWLSKNIEKPNLLF